MQKPSKRLLCTIAVLIIAVVSVQAQQQHAFSVEQAVGYGIKNSIAVKKALADVKIQNEVNREITSAAYPNISGSFGINYFPNVPIQSFPNFIAAATYGVLQQEGVKNGSGQPIISPNDFGFVQAQFGTKYTSSAEISASQLLFDGQVFIGLQARSAAMKLTHKQVAITEEMIKANIHNIYWQLVIGRKQLEAFDANILVLEKFLNETKELYKSGFREKLDIDKVTVQLVNLKTEKTKIENQIDAGYAGLKLLMGMPQKDKLELTDSLSEGSIKKDILTDNNYQYGDRKEFQALETVKQLQQYNVMRYQYSYIPTLALFGSYSRNAQRNDFSIFKSGNQYPWFKSSIVGVKLAIPIFDGMAKDARIKKARFELEKTKLEIDNLKQAIDYDVTLAQSKIRNAIIAMDFQKQNAELAQKVYDTEQLKYEQGLGSNLEVLNAQANLKSAQINYYASIYDAIIAKTDYLKAVGKL
jgi:outer membrane protein TolC